MHFEHVLGFEGNDFQRPGVGADGDDAFADQILCAFDAEAWFTRVVTLVVLADQAYPAGVEYDDVALTNFDALLLRDLLISLTLKAVPSLTTSVPR